MNDIQVTLTQPAQVQVSFPSPTFSSLDGLDATDSVAKSTGGSVYRTLGDHFADVDNVLLDKYKIWARYIIADDTTEGISGGGSLAMSSALGPPNQGYLLGNWYFGGNPADDRLARDGASPQILFALTDSVGEGYLAGDLIFFTSTLGSAGDATAWLEKFRIRGPNSGYGISLSDLVDVGAGGGDPARVRIASFSTTYCEVGFNSTDKAYINGYDGSASTVFISKNGGGVNLGGILEYVDNAAAVLAGAIIGTVYRTGDILKIVH